MASILSIDTSTPVCSVALAINGTTVHHAEIFEDFSHASHLTVLIEKLFADNQLDIKNIDAVAVSSGPGSYTGLRIGVSTAKGLCYALSKPLIAIGSLHILAHPVTKVSESKADALFCPMIDARRMEVYTAIFNGQMTQLEGVSAKIIDTESFANILANRRVYFFGNGAEKCKNTITHPNAVFIEQCVPLAKYMGELAQTAFDNKRFEDVAYFEPHYLKEFVATTPKQKNL